jgi:hypothetical protein
VPAGNQSTQSFQATVNTTDLGSTYKAKIDADTSILGNPAGSFYVYPQSLLTVNIDGQGYTFMQSGQTNPVVIGGNGSQTLLTLAAPGSNSYYACVYWNTSTSAAGVIYSPTASSPSPILPDDAALIPLAFILLTNGQSTISASNISDARSLIPAEPVKYNNTSLGANQTVNCNGASRVIIDIVITTSLTLTLTNLQVGIPVEIYIAATTGTPTIKIAGSTPSGAAVSMISKVAGASTAFNVNLTTTGITFGSTSSFMLHADTEYYSNIPTWKAIQS